MYGLSEEDLLIQAQARGFADELIPFEDEAERADGQLPADVTAAHAKRCRELGLHSTNMPRELGGGGCTSLQQVLVQEQMGRVTNALGWVAATPPSWLPAVATRDQIDRYVRPAVAGDREECYAITEEGAGSDVDAIEATARRDGEDYLLNGVKWHVTSYNLADYGFVQAVLTGGPNAGEHALFVLDTQLALQDDRDFLELRPLPGLFPSARRHHPRHADRRVAGVDAAGELLDLFRLRADAVDDRGLVYEFRHVVSLYSKIRRITKGRRSYRRSRRVAASKVSKVEGSWQAIAASAVVTMP